jgi:hypothetical protein
MSISIDELAVQTFVPVLKTLVTLLEKGAAHARAAGSPATALLDARLAPDMFPLSTQVQLACHHARDAVARLTGNTAPTIDNRDLTWDELEALVTGTVEHLEHVKPAAFAGAEKRQVQMPLQGTTVFRSNGLQFLRDWSLPNFYFHAVTAYDILRHAGVAVGKRDYLSHIGPYLRQPVAR